MAFYKEISSKLIYKSDPNRKRIFTIPAKAFIDKGDIQDKDLMELWKTKLEYLGHFDIEIYFVESINEDIPIGEEGRIWTYHHFRTKRYDNPIDIKKKFKLIKQLHGKEKTIKWFNDLYEPEAIKLLGEI